MGEDAFQLRLKRLTKLQEAVEEYVKTELVRVDRDVKFLLAVQAGRKKGEAAGVKPIEIVTKAAATSLYDYLSGVTSTRRAIRPPFAPPSTGKELPWTGKTYQPPPPVVLSEGDMVCHHCWGWTTVPPDEGTCFLCEGTGKLKDQQLSTNFKLSQLVASQQAVSYRISNDPDGAAISGLRRLCNEILERVKLGFGNFTINSGYRSVELNQAVSGEPVSAHVYGLGADINPSLGGPKLMMDWLVGARISHDQFIYEGTWCHVAVARPVTMEQRNLNLMALGGAYYPYDPTRVS